MYMYWVLQLDIRVLLRTIGAVTSHTVEYVRVRGHSIIYKGHHLRISIYYSIH